MDITKLDDNSIQVQKTEPEKVVTHNYDYDFLLNQRSAIQSQLEQRQIELNEVNALIAEADKLGVSSKVEDESPQELKL